jgi:hypothetical protein
MPQEARSQSVPIPCVTSMTLHSAVHIPLTIGEDKLIEGSITVLSIIRPTWTKENINFKVSFCCTLVVFKIMWYYVECGDTKLYFPPYLCGVIAHRWQYLDLRGSL